MRVTVPSPALDDPHRVAHRDAARVVADRDRVALRPAGLRVRGASPSRRRSSSPRPSRRRRRCRAGACRPGSATPATWPESRAIRVTVPSPAFVTHTNSSVTASDSGARPTGIRFAVPSSSIRSTAPSPDETTQRIPSSSTSGLSGWRPAGIGLPSVSSSASIWSRRPAVASATHTTAPSSSTVMPSGPRPGADRLRHRGLVAPAAGVAVAVAVAATSVPETKAATALISAPDSRPPNAGMPPSPLVTICCTRWALGLASSRFGPVVPEEPAAASVWQPPQPADAKTRLARTARRAVASLRRPRGLLLGPDQRRAREQHQDHDPPRAPTSAGRGCGRSSPARTATGTRCWR